MVRSQNQIQKKAGRSFRRMQEMKREEEEVRIEEEEKRLKRKVKLETARAQRVLAIARRATSDLLSAQENHARAVSGLAEKICLFQLIGNQLEKRISKCPNPTSDEGAFELFDIHEEL
ncbi:hypothetical protein QAD02_000048 [Eretmocerus hayati]|uniref:Uncharacterized protein n=1 Tax=Eretmocerus hayati TaxID=131215 RepID=A0ACC2NCI7_9HYME|nr:hypothetical protein QAD02_000048 [Eretmocerus hayati]